MGSCRQIHCTPDNDEPDNSHCSRPRCVERLELVRLIRRWRTASRKAAGSASGAKGLAVLGLFKVETMLSSSSARSLIT